MIKPFFSIVIPTYQSASTINSCLTSVLDQSFTDFEIIVQDGQSTDGTCDLIRKFADSRLRLFSEKDCGVYDAMNRAIGRLSGQWVLFLGSDDRLYADDTLAMLHTFLASTPSADLVYGNVIMAGDSHWIKDGEIYMGETHLALLFQKNLCQQSILYNKQIFERGERYNLTYPVLADYDLNLRCFARYKITYTTQVIAVYSTGGLSSTTADEPFARDKWINIIRYYRYALLSASLAAHKQDFKRAAKHLLRNGTPQERMLALAVYLYFKFT
ncbi:glycosyltransferase family 2 protein [Parapedobacter soli]|uniref:glycosyltransferase family 2 protein n=1 Tax=Parapedobacter soli TaxID=416955 RepID=UPI0021CA7B6E|nr:glycosyltransferase family 2 protein [Parapedobacter soli]